MNLTRKSWPRLWTPSADQVNGDPGGLLRADNLQLDEEGTLSLTRGIKQLTNNLPDYVYKLASRLINGTEYVWAALNISGRAIVRTSTYFDDYDFILEEGGGKACFGAALGNEIISCGSKRIKDNGTRILPLGLKTPTDAPVVTAINQQQLNISGSGAVQCAYAAVEGSNLTQEQGSAWITVDPVTLRAAIECTYNGEIDTINFGIPGLNSNVDPGDDTFSMLFQLSDSSQYQWFQIIFDLDGSYGNTYSHVFAANPLDTSADVPFVQGIDAQTVVTLKRKAFTRAGSDTTKSWKTVQKFKIIGQAITATAGQFGSFLAGEQTFTGGIQGSFNSDYQYACVNVADNGIYVAKSGLSPATNAITFFNGYASVQLPALVDGQVNQVWLFRKSIATQRPNETLNLPNWYFVGKGNPGDTITDTTTDNAALEQNITANINLVSIQDIPDSIIAMEGLYNERMLYLTQSEILLSDRINPDAIDSRFTIKVFGDPTEQNLFIKALTNNTLILATTKDLYYISGTLLDSPDGTLDITIQAIGEAYPPLSEDFAFSDGSLYYVAADGVRLTVGSNSVRIPGLELLFQGMNRYGIAPVILAAGNQAEYSLSTGNGKLYLALPMTDGTRYFITYTFASKQWRLQFTDPVSIHATQTDVVILGYNLSTNNFTHGGVFQANVGYGITDSSGALLEGVPFTLQTVCDDDGKPRNRKDTFTLKVICDTGGSDVSLYVNVNNVEDINGTAWQFVGNINHNGLATSYFDMSSFTLGFRYAFKIVDKALVTFFKLYELTLEYEARPEQLNYLRIQNNNLGSVSRKRIVSYAFIIDTLGNNITFTPYVDNVAAISDIVNTGVKDTYIYYFTGDTTGTDFGGILQGGVFEFYQLNNEEIVSEKMPIPCKFLVIPANNYGTPNRKRHTSYKFQINTRGGTVTFTPIVDGVAYATATYNNTKKTTVEYFFDTSIDVTGIDIGGTLSSSSPFEFYGVIVPQEVETLPSRLESLYTAYTNFGTASRKRLRTLPIVIYTYGQDVSFTPSVDGVLYPTQIFNTSFKQTVLYYFVSDVFGIDIQGTLIGTSPFEFYGFGEPEIVEVLPVGKKFDQFQPLRFDKVGNIFAFRIRLIAIGSTVSIPYSLYDDSSFTVDTNSAPIISSSFTVLPGADMVYEIFLPKSINLTVGRLTLGPTNDPFYRYDVQIKVTTSGMESDSRWVPLR